MRWMKLVSATAAVGALSLGATAAAAQDFQVIREVAVGNEPGPVIAGYGAGWVANQQDGTVTRINETTGATQTITIGSNPVAFGTGYGSVWVVTGGDGGTATIYRLNGSTGAVQRTIRAALTIEGGQNTASIGPAGGYMWVGATGQGKLIRIDPSSNKATVRSAPSNAGFTTGDGKLWMVAFNSNGTALLQSRRPSNVSLIKQINISSIVDGTGFSWITFGSSQIYVAQTEPNDDGIIGVVDVGKSRVTATYDTNIELQCIKTGNNALWAAVDDDDLSGEAAKVAALNEDNLSVLREQQPFPTGSTTGSVTCVTAGSGYVWVPSGQSPGSVYQLVSATSTS